MGLLREILWSHPFVKRSEFSGLPIGAIEVSTNYRLKAQRLITEIHPPTIHIEPKPMFHFNAP
jgi:hypothetical protein